MALIPEEEIERIKRETDLAAVARARGIELKPQGGDLVGLCPFHDDHHPSLHVTPGARLWRCVSCNAAGNVIQFVQRFDGVSFRHAAELLQNGAAAYKAVPTGPVKKSTVPRLANPLAGVNAADEHAADQEALRRVLDYYHERLALNPSALGYLDKRGLNDPELLRAFRVGFCDRTLGLRMPQANRKEGAALRTRLERLGIMRETGHEHFRGQIVVPVVAADGTIGTIYGRAAGIVPKENRHRFLPGPQNGVFNPAALAADTLQASQGAVILTEGILDALTWWRHGWKNVTTCFSARQPSPDVIDAISKAGVRTVVLAFDPDRAGDGGTQSAAALLLARGIECRRVRFPHGHDANSYALAVKPPRQALTVLLNAAEFMGKGKVSAAAAPSSDASRASSSLAARAASVAAEPAPTSEKKPAPVTPTAAPEKAAREKTPEVIAAPSGERAPTSTTAAPVVPSTPTLQPRGEHWFLELDGREWRVGGMDKLAAADALKVAVRVRVGDAFHLDTFDLARDLDRRRFVERAAEETRLHPDLLKRDVGRLLFAVESAIAARAAQAAQAAAESAAVVLSPEEKAEALTWAREPNLIARLKDAFRRAGIVGEETNTLIGYLCCVSRLLDKPLAAILQSPSAAGKTTVMDSILAFFPEESRVKYSAMTGQSLFYMGDYDLRHKILAIVEEAGAEKASYALKLLQSEQELRIASTGKNPQTGRMETQEYHVEGPVMIMLTTTAIDLDEELQNRCLTLAVDDSPEQTARIHTVQRERRTLAGLVAKAEHAGLLGLMKNVQRLLEPLEVLNDYAPRLIFPTHQARNRRDHEKYLTLIDSIALLHQHQRPRRTRPVKGGKLIAYIEATLDDIALANQLAPEVLGRSLDELPPQTRRLLDHVRALVRAKRERESDKTAALFTRRELHEGCGWSFTQLRVHLERLVEQEYLATRCGRFGSLYVYELLIDADAPAHVAHIKLIDVETLRRAPNLAGSGANLTGPNGYLAGGDGAPPSGASAPHGSALGETLRPDGNAHQAGAGADAA
jgi:DNA primase catalytic core